MPYIPVGAAGDLAIFHTRRADICVGFVRCEKTIFPADDQPGRGCAHSTSCICSRYFRCSALVVRT